MLMLNDIKTQHRIDYVIYGFLEFDRFTLLNGDFGVHAQCEQPVRLGQFVFVLVVVVVVVGDGGDGVVSIIITLYLLLRPTRKSTKVHPSRCLVCCTQSIPIE